jgi:tetratricopeptide (TPR) repeat protein
MTPLPSKLASDAPSPTIDQNNPPQTMPQTRASDLDASGAGVQTSAVSPEPVAPYRRYILTAFHARGGMGEVWRCQDATIRREVALKRLVSDRTAARERFLAEAQVTGQLQHPGIVPVYDMGFDENGRPYYIMSFVQGQTLKAAIHTFHAPDGQCDQRTKERTRLLKIFLDVCNAVAYAHSRGIIHRDLKPDNIMLGPFGETVLLDWGLAKLRDLSELAGPVPPSAPPALAGSSFHTADGSIMGSPLYMPPEMAQGHIADADARTDVYLLGATLYEVLTGRPPRQGANREEILEMARTSTPVPPRKIHPDTPRALEAICLKAMSSARSARYESALQLADEVQCFLAGEPVAAYPEALPARAWRWMKRHHKALSRTAAAAAIVTCIFAAVLATRHATRLRGREQARLDLQNIRNLIDQSHFYAANIDPPGEVAPYYDVGRGEQSARDALSAAEKWGPTLEALPLADQRDPLRRELSELCLCLAHFQLARPETASHTLPTSPASRTQALALLDRADRFAPPTRTSHHLRAIAARLDHREADALAEQKLANTAGTPPSAYDLFLEAEHARIDTAAQAARILIDPNSVRASARSITRAAELYQASLRLNPTNYWAYFHLSRCYLELNRWPDAVESLGACIALRPESPWAYSARGLAQALLHRFDEARLDLDRALQLDPECVAARLNRGILFRLQDRPAHSAAEFESLLASAHAPPEAAIYRGQLYLLADDPSRALKLFGQFQSPQVALVRAYAHLRLGQIDEARHDLDPLVATSAGEPTAAKAAAMRGHLFRCLAAQLPPQQQIAALDLASIELKHASDSAPTAATFADLGAVLHQQRHYEQAIESLTRAIALAPDDAQILNDRGWVNEKLNYLKAAQADFAAAVRISPHPAEAMTGLGYIAARLGNAREAQLEASLALTNGSYDYHILHNVACIYAQLSVTDAAQKSTHEAAAIAYLNRALDSFNRGWGGPQEIDLIRNEVAFPASLRSRPDFTNLILEIRTTKPE